METGSRRRLQTAVRVPNVILCKYCTNPFIPLTLIHCFIVIPSSSVYLSTSLCVCVLLFLSVCVCVGVYCLALFLSQSLYSCLFLSLHISLTLSLSLTLTHSLPHCLSHTHSLFRSLFITLSHSLFPSGLDRHRCTADHMCLFPYRFRSHRIPLTSQQGLDNDWYVRVLTCLI